MESALLDFMLTNKDLITTDRPLRLRLDIRNTISDDLLLPQRVYGTQSMCGGIEYRILCVSIRYDLALKDFIGVSAALDFVTDRGELHSVCGLVTEVSAGDSDGGLASYQLVLRDALALMERRINSRVFRLMNEVEIVRQLIHEWCHSNPLLGLAFTCEQQAGFHLLHYPQREFTMQHNESDAAFMRRLLKRRGIAWHFRARHGDPYPHHTLVLCNNIHGVQESGAGTVRYHRHGATEERDAITAWSAERILQPASTGRHSWDYQTATGNGIHAVYIQSQHKQGGHAEAQCATLDDYQLLPPHAGDDHHDLGSLARQAQQRHDHAAKCFHGEGTVRDLAAGEYFTLQGHPEIDTHRIAEDRQFTVTALRVAAMNNLPKQLGERIERLFARNHWLRQGEDGWLQRELGAQAATGGVRMRVHFTAVRRDTLVMPAYDPRHDLPRPQLQSAIVVGPEGEEVHCDQLGRVKVRFPGAQTGGIRINAGPMYTGVDSAWVRVATHWAGDGPGSQRQCGTLTLPRVGTEVLVGFLGGDPDKPVIVGQLFNGAGHPVALSSKGELPGNRYLSGIKSREIRGGRANQLRFDDTEGQISAQLASDHGSSQLNLGMLVEPRSQGYGALRGAGAELRSDEQVAVRAAKGILLSAWASLDARGKQMERAAYLSLMGECLDLFRSLGTYAAKHQALPVDEAAHGELAAAIKEWNDQSAVIGATAPDGISFATSKALVSYAARNIDTVAGQHLQLTAAQRFNVNAGKGISLFSHSDGLQAIAHHGKLLLQSQHDDTRIDSARDTKITAAKRLTVMAEEIAFVNTGGAYIRLKGGDVEIGGPGSFTVKTDGHNWNGPASEAAELPSFGEGEFGRAPCLVRASDGEPVPDMQLYLEREGDSPLTGTTDANGEVEQVSTSRVQKLKARFYRRR